MTAISYEFWSLKIRFSVCLVFLTCSFGYCHSQLRKSCCKLGAVSFQIGCVDLLKLSLSNLSYFNLIYSFLFYPMLNTCILFSPLYLQHRYLMEWYLEHQQWQLLQDHVGGSKCLRSRIIMTLYLYFTWFYYDLILYSNLGIRPLASDYLFVLLSFYRQHAHPHSMKLLKCSNSTYW